MYVRNCWYVAGWDYSFSDDALASRMIMNEPIVFYRKTDGTLVAMEDRCCHRFAPLSRGRQEGDDLRCMYHGLKFAPSGKCVEIPGQETIPAGMGVRTYPVVERHSWYWVWMGDPALADPALIPNAVGLDDPAWRLQSGELDYAANYLLINDNLLDFTHLNFTHENTLGIGTDHVNAPPKITRLDRGVRVERWIRPNGAVSPLRPLNAADVDRWSSYDFLLPGILLLRGEAYPAGTAAAANGGPPPDSGKALSRSFSSQAVTPMTDDTSHYVFSWGVPKEEGDDAVVAGMMKLANAAFAEDKAMIEAQQKIVDKSPGLKMAPIASDKGLSQFRWMLERMVQAEAGEGRTLSAVAS